MEKDPLKDIINHNFQQEVPSFDFTQEVMKKIEEASEKKTEIEPLISKKTFSIIGALYACLFLIPFFGGMQEATFVLWEQLNFLSIDVEQFKSNLILFSSLIFVFASLTLSDMVLRLRNELETV